MKNDLLYRITMRLGGVDCEEYYVFASGSRQALTKAYKVAEKAAKGYVDPIAELESMARVRGEIIR